MQSLAATLDKPRAITLAERALWLWVAWTCVYGLSQAFGSGAQHPLGEEFGGLLALDKRTVLLGTIAWYALAAVSIAWVIVKIGEARRWARSTLLWSFVVEALWLSQDAGTPSELLSNIPDLVLQLAALYLLYTKPGRDWFSVAK